MDDNQEDPGTIQQWIGEVCCPKSKFSSCTVSLNCKVLRLAKQTCKDATPQYGVKENIVLTNMEIYPLQKLDHIFLHYLQPPWGSNVLVPHLLNKYRN